MIKQQLLLLMFCLMGNLGFTQKQLSLIECVNIAIENSLELQQTEYDYEQAFLDYEQSKLEKYPNLNASTSHSLNFGRSLDFTTYDFNTQTTQANSFGLSTSATLFSGGRIKENVALQNMFANRAKTSIATLKDQIAITVAANFLAVISAKEQIKTAEIQVQLRQQDVERTKKLIEEGVTAGAELYDMEAQLSNTEFQLQQAKNNYQVMLLDLKQSMLYPFDKELDVTPPDLEVPPIDMVEEELNPVVVYQNALLTQHVIQGAEKDIDIAKQTIKLAESEKFPTISITGGVDSYHSDQAQEVVGERVIENRIPVQGINDPAFIEFVNAVPIREQSPFFNQLGNNLAQNIGIRIDIPIFNRGQINNQIKKATVDVERARVQSEIQKRELRQNIQSAYLDAILARKAYDAAKKQVDLLSKSTEFAKKRYDIGTASIYDYFTTQNNLANAQVELTRAKYDYLYKVKILEFYKDNNFEF